MSMQANLKSLTIDGIQYSPSGEWTLQLGSATKETTANLDGTLSTKYTPEPDMATGPIRFPGGTALRDLVAKSNITLTAVLRDGSVYQSSGGMVVNHVELNTDGGEVELEFAGKARFL